MDLMLVEVIKNKIKFIFLFFKAAGPARASRRSIWPASNDNLGSGAHSSNEGKLQDVA
jgi:hypothetical protein